MISSQFSHCAKSRVIPKVFMVHSTGDTFQPISKFVVQAMHSGKSQQEEKVLSTSHAVHPDHHTGIMDEVSCTLDQVGLHSSPTASQQVMHTSREVPWQPHKSCRASKVLTKHPEHSQNSQRLPIGPEVSWDFATGPSSDLCEFDTFWRS